MSIIFYSGSAIFFILSIISLYYIFVRNSNLGSTAVHAFLMAALLFIFGIQYDLKSWECCGETTTSDYCTICGQINPKKEIEDESKRWTCCDNNYNGEDKFCADCGTAKPENKENVIIIEKDGTTAIYEYDNYKITNQ